MDNSIMNFIYKGIPIGYLVGMNKWQVNMPYIGFKYFNTEDYAKLYIDHMIDKRKKHLLKNY